jgi:iron-sulfur cluster insertion protein
MSVIIEPAAIAKVKELIEMEGNPNLKMRAFVTGGGCSGFTYGFQFTEEIEEDDTVYTFDTVTVLVDPMSFQYLSGATIDFKDDLDGASFVIKNNPAAVTTCGCGSSFSA